MSSDAHRLVANDSIASMNHTSSSAFSSELMAAISGNDYGFMRRNGGGTAATNPYSLGSDDQIAVLRAQLGSNAGAANPGSAIHPEAAQIPTFKNRCPGGHDLRADVYSDTVAGGISLQPRCSGCGSEIATAGFIWRCRENCDFKLCDNCRFGR